MLNKIIILVCIIEATYHIEFNCAESKNDLGEEPKFAKGKNVYICLHALPFGVKVAFQIKVDEMIALTVRRSYEALRKDTDVFV